jgi:hypothetical protein
MASNLSYLHASAALKKQTERIESYSKSYERHITPAAITSNFAPTQIKRDPRSALRINASDKIKNPMNYTNINSFLA